MTPRKKHVFYSISSVCLIYLYASCCRSAVSSGHHHVSVMACVSACNSCLFKCHQPTNYRFLILIPCPQERESMAWFTSTQPHLWFSCEWSGELWTGSDMDLCFLPWNAFDASDAPGSSLYPCPLASKCEGVHLPGVDICSNSEWALLHKCSCLSSFQHAILAGVLYTSLEVPVESSPLCPQWKSQ